MGRKKCHPSAKCKQHIVSNKKIPQLKRISPAKRNEISIQCEKLFHLSSNPAYENQLWENYIQISIILEKVKRLEEMKIESSKRSEAIGHFIKWLKEDGANIDGVNIAEFPGYDLGLKAERNFNEGQIILEIPRKLIFCTQTAAPELNVLQNDPLVQHMPHVALAIALLIERHKENSVWKPYLDILPNQYNTVLYMSANDMIELKGSPTLEAALKQCRNIARQYSYFNRFFQSSQNAVSDLLKEVFTYEEYCWAVSTVMTRQNRIPNEDGSKMIYGLIPMWDMCNHEEGKITTDFNRVSDKCECYALRNFEAGEQIFIAYGARTNSDFFVHSGFVSLDNKQVREHLTPSHSEITTDSIGNLFLNPNCGMLTLSDADGFKLRLGISKADALQKERIELLGKLALPSNDEFLLKPGMEPISDDLLAFLRVFSMRKPELEHWLQSDKVLDLKHVDCALETVIEENVRRFMLTRLKLLIANYPTTLEEDIEMLNTTLSQHKKIALQLRVTEKRILQGALDYVEQWIKA